MARDVLVASSLGIDLLSKLQMSPIAEFDPLTLFDAVEEDEALIRMARRPRSRISHWSDPERNRDLSNAFELKRELDRNALFKEYEDRFPDLFRKAEKDAQ